MASSAMLATTAAVTETSAAAEETAATTKTTVVTATSAASLLEEGDDECKDDDVLNRSLRSCANDPDFAVICAFLQKFAKELGLELPNFKRLQEWLTNTDEVAAQIRDLHIKLMRKTRKTVHEKSWESALSKFCFTYSAQDGWEVERFGYKQASLKVKLRILRELLESQFERNGKFRNKILTLSADSLRSQPIGRDRLGHSYWLTQDADCNLRIYQEHLDEEIWQVVATNRDEFVNLIARLRGNEVVLPATDIGVIDEDTSSSNSCLAPIEKPPPPEEKDDSQEEEIKVPNLRIKMSSDGSYQSGKDLGKGEEELAAEEDKKLEQRKLKTVAGVVEQDDGSDDDGDEDEEEEEESEEEEEEDSGEEEQSEDEVTSISKIAEKTKIVAPAVEVQKKVKPIVISNAKIVSSASAPHPTTTNSAAKKRFLDEVDKTSPRSDDIINSIKKFRPSLLDSKREKKPSKYGKAKSEDEDDEDDDESEESEEEDEADIDDVEDECEEEDIDSAAAEEDENEEKDIEDDDYDDLEVGEAIEDPPIRVFGEGSGKQCDGANPEFSSEFLLIEENLFLLSQDEDSEPEVGEAIEEEYLYICGEGHGAECLVGNKNSGEEPTTPTTTKRMNEPKATFFFGEPGCLKLSPIKKSSTSTDVDALSNDEENAVQGKAESSANCIEVEQIGEPLKEETILLKNADNDSKNCGDNDKEQNVKISTKIVKEKQERNCEENNEKNNQPNEKKYEENVKENDREEKKLDLEQVLKADSQNTPENASNDIVKNKNGENNVQKENLTIHHIQELESNNLNVEKVAEGQFKEKTNENIAFNGGEINKTTNEIQERQNIDYDHTNKSTEMEVKEESKQEFENQSEKKSYNQAEKLRHKTDDNLQKPTSSKMLQNPIEFAIKPDEKAVERFSQKLEQISKEKSSIPLKVSLENNAFLKVQENPDLNINEKKNESNPEIKKEQEISLKTQKIQETQIIDLKNEKKTITSNVRTKDEEKEFSVKGISENISLKNVNDESENKITPKEQEKCEKSSFDVKKVALKLAGGNLKNSASHNVEEVKDVEKSYTDVEEKSEPCSSKMLGITLKKNLFAYSENLSINADAESEQKLAPYIEKNSNNKSPSSSENKSSNKSLTKQHNNVKTTDSDMVEKVQNVDAAVCRQLSPPNSQTRKESSVLELQQASRDNISFNRSSPLKLIIKEPQKVSTTSSLPNRKRRLADFEASEQTNTCQLTTSDSELDFHIDKTLEPPQVAADDIGYDVGNVGGKRLKMRGKLTNSEIRKKVEAQKIAAVEETTSSSGEEEALRKRKIISPKRQLLDHKTQKMEVQKKSDFSVKTVVPEVKEVAAKLGPSLLKQKPTLAEIVEKTLKKTAEKSEAHLVVSACTSQEATGNLRNSKTSSVIKPLKKNLLIQLRQEESDEETIPRKRTISETIHHSVERASTKLVTIAPKKEEEEITRTRPDRTTPDRQRKRRSSEEIKQIVVPDHKNPQTSECVGEKLKKNDANISKEMSENEKPSKDFPYVVKSLEMTKEGEQNKQPKSLHPKSLDANPVLPIVETIKPVIKEELLKTIVEDITPVIKDEITTPTTVGRRSGRRGGATVIYSELPQPKRTRGGISKATASITKSKKEDTPEKMDESQTKLKQEAMEIKKSLASPELSKLTTSAKEFLTKSDTPKSITSSAAMEDQQTSSTPLEAEITKSATLKEKSNLITSEEDDEQKPSTPLKASSSVTKTASPKSTPNARGRGRKNKEVDTTNILELVDSETPVRQSRRIAQQKIREEAERRKLEEIALRTMKNELKKKKKAEAQADPTVPEPSEHSSSSNESDASEVEAEEAKKSKKKKCPGKDGTWSSGSEEQEEPEEEEEPPHYETDPGSPLFRSDHEFSPESDLEDESQVVPMKRARTARKEDGGDVLHQDQEEEACQKCGKSDHPEWILLCDSCDKGYHCSCLLPVLFYIPEGDWHCPPCQQEHLIAALEKQLQDFDDLVEQKRLEQEQAQRLAQEAERVEKQRQEEEKRKKKKKKQRGDDEGSENEDDEKSDAAKVGTKESGDDDDDKTLKKDKKSKKNQSIEKRKQRHETAGTRRRRRKAATRGARRRRRNEAGGSADSDGSSGSGSRSGSDSGSGSSSSSSSSSSASDSEDEPIYKLRKRRQINVSYRLNEYDDLINSALKKEMDEAAGAGNLGRGKDITTIIEADKEEQARHTNVEDDEVIKPDNHAVKKETEEMTEKQPEIVKTENADEHEKKNAKEDVDSEEEPLQRKANTKTLKKKPRKLTTLDISSEEDNASDEDFKGSSLDDDDEDTSVSVSSNSDSSLEIYRRRNKKGKKKTRKVARRAARERRKVKKFVVDDSDDDEEEVSRPKTKKKRKTDSDYTESEEDDENSELSENVDSADLCDDSTSSEGSDGAWCPSKRKKKRKANVPIARKSPKLKKPQIKKPKRVEYSDDDISEEEEEDYDDDDDDLATGGKGSGKQPRTVPLKKSNSGKGKGKGKGGAGAGKSSKAGTASKKKKRNLSDYDDESLSESDDSTRKTRGRRYAYLEDFEDDSSDGGIKPGVQRPDTPPEEREKFIKKQEEIKRMLAEKNAEGAKLAATPRLTPIKGGTRSPAKPGDSLSTVPLSVIRQAKVLDIDYLQRKGESVSDVDNVDDVDSEFDDADLPDDFPEDMDEDAIARMVEEEEEFGAANASRELPAPDEVLKPSAAKAKPRESEKPVTNQAPNPSLVAMSHIPTTATVGPSASASGLQEPLRKRLPMPTMHPPLLRHQYPGGGHHQIPPHMMQRHAGPPTHLLQNALSAPLGQPIHRHFPHQAPGTQRGPPGGGMPPRHALPPHTLPPPQQQLAASHPLHGAAGSAAASEPKPRGRRKKITPLRDPLQKQQAAAAATAAAAVQAATTVSGNGKTESSSTTAVATGVIKNASSLTIAQPPQLYKPPGGGGASAGQVQPSVITRMPHLPQHSGPPGRGMPHGPPGLYAGGDARFYGSPMQQPGVGVHGSRLSPAGSQRHRGPPHGSGMAPHHSMRPSYGPPPPLRGVVGPPNQPSSVSGTRAAYHPPPNHGDHRGPQPTGPYGPSPPARHAAPHMNPYRRPSIFGNPNYAPRGAQPGSNLRNAGPPGQDYTAGPPRSYAPYGYYPPPPPLTAAHPPASSAPHPPAPTTHAPNISTSQPSTTHAPSSTTTLPSAVPSSVIVSAPPSSHSLTSVPTSAAAALQKHATPRVIPKSAPNAPTQTTSGGDKSSPSASSASAKAHLAAVVVEPRKKLITLETFATSKSPLAISGESSGSRSSPNVQPDGADDSTSRPAAATSAGDGQGASEFSGLVSYFSSQHDDYNT